MAEIENIEEINENFDTIKTLLNSIRAQGILNTSDVDKLLTGINAKLEKINTDDDIDLLKINLADLQKTLEERHSTVISKFGAIESLFSNLLKNSSETLKSSEIKELFDIVATNLSVFSREIVSQKESLNDISLRLETLRSDDTQKKEIIKSVSLLKPDIERLSNGFDSMVINLNDGFKSIVNSISALDNAGMIDKLSGVISDIEMSSKAVLSAIQVMDKKSENLEESLKNLYSKDDAAETERKLSEISLMSRETTSVISELNDRYGRIDILAEKIDASVNVIVNLKSVLAEIGDKTTSTLLEKLEILEKSANEINNDTKFAEFKKSFDEIVVSALESLDNISKDNKNLKESIDKISEQLSSIDAEDLKKYIASLNENATASIKNSIEGTIKNFNTAQDEAITKVLSDISSGTDALENKLKKVGTDISSLCEKGLNAVLVDIGSIKTSITQIDESNVSANNAIFSNITDRLTNFEESLIVSLKNQEMSVKSSAQAVETNFQDLKKISGVLDYKIDASIVESTKVKETLETVQESVDSIIALDFVEKIKDLRADLYASKQDIVNVLELDSKGINSNLSGDISEKYDSTITKIEELEKSIKQSQVSSLAGINTLLENISSSIVDVLSYVSETNNTDSVEYDKKFDEINETLKENHIGYIESVRDIVSVAQENIQKNIDTLIAADAEKFADVKSSVETATSDIKNEIKYAYTKLIEIQELYKELSKCAEANKADSSEQFDKVLNSTEELKNAYIAKIDSVNEAIAEKILDFKQDYTCDNANRINEIKLYTESISTKNLKDILENIESVKTSVTALLDADGTDKNSKFEKLQEYFSALSELIVKNSDSLKEDYTASANALYKAFDDVKNVISKFDENIDGDMSRQLALIESSFEVLSERINEKLSKIDSVITKDVSDKLETVSGEAIAQLDKKILNYSNEVASTLKLLKDDVEKQTIALKDEILNGNDQIFTESLKNNVSTYLKGFAEEFAKVNGILAAISEKYSDGSNYVNAELTKLSDSINEIHVELSKTDNIDSLRLELVNLSSNINDLHEELSKTNNTDSINSELVHIADNIDELHNELLKTDNIDSLRSELVNLSSNINDLQEGLLKANNTDSINSELVHIADNIDELHNELSKTDNIDSLRLELVNLSSNINDLQEGLLKANNTDSINSELVHIADNIDELHNELLKTDNIDSLKAELTNISGNINELHNKFIQALQEQLENVGNNNSIPESALEELETSISEKVVTLNSVLSKINGSAESVSSIVDNIYSTIQTDKDILESVKISIMDSISADVTNLLENIDKETQAIISGISEQLDIFEQHSKEDTAILKDKLEQILNTSTENADDLKDYLSDQFAEIKFGNNIDNIKLYIDQTLATLKDPLTNLLKADEFMDIFRNFETNNESLIKNTINETIAEVDSKLNDNLLAYKNILQSSFDKTTDDIKLLQDKVESLDDLLGNFTETTGNDKVVSAIEDAHGDIINLHRLLEDIEQNIKEHSTEVVTNTYGTDGLKEDLNDLSAVVSNIEVLLHETVNKNENLLNGLGDNTASEVKGIHQAITEIADQLRNDIAKANDIIKSTVDNTEHQVNKLAESVENINIQLLNTINEEKELSDTVTSGIDGLYSAVDELKVQILNNLSNKTEQVSVECKLDEIKSIIEEQMGYVQDISSMCSENLLDIPEMEIKIGKKITDAIDTFSEKISSLEPEQEDLELLFKNFKSEIITQFINIFNQISFVAEQEEILDFIDEKHTKLIDVLSHIVTSTESTETKIASIKEELGIINKKVTQILSSEEDEIDYVYSLQDLESDIANLRLVLNEMKNSTSSEELNELINSTSEIYKLVDAIKRDIPTKKDIENIAEDIVSISTRTNKLILASDESYKTLQDNLGEFKLVIDDLDERTRNFAHDSGMDKIDLKLNTLNDMMISGAKTNQVFNQVFEYLAEWVDKAGLQINAISDKVETLDDIGQIKVMLADLKEKAEDDSESVELIEALGNVFDKQTKKISAIEAKIDKMIVQTTIDKKKTEKAAKIDMSPMENTLNSFLVAIDEKFAQQEAKIGLLEKKLESVLEGKDTDKVSKKLTGIDKQIAKLNKSIENIVSDVIKK